MKYISWSADDGPRRASLRHALSQKLYTKLKNETFNLVLAVTCYIPDLSKSYIVHTNGIANALETR